MVAAVEEAAPAGDYTTIGAELDIEQAASGCKSAVEAPVVIELAVIIEFADVVMELAAAKVSEFEESTGQIY